MIVAEKLKVVLTDYEYESIASEKREMNGIGADLIVLQCKTEEDLINATGDADALLNQYAQITRRVIENMKKCQVIVRYGVGVDNIDVAAASEHKIMVCNVPNYGLEEVADHAMALLLSSIRKITYLNQAVKSLKWDYKMAEPMYRIRGKKLGLIAYGNIARLVGERARVFGMEILVYDPWLDPAAADKNQVKLLSFEELLIESDYISIHCPLNDNTRGMFNQEVFEKMKNSAVLVNTARGPIIDEKALAAALKKGQIAAAALDVTEQEPLQEQSELRGMDNVIITPHAAWYSVEAQQRLQLQAAQEAARVLKGNPPLNLVNKEIFSR